MPQIMCDVYVAALSHAVHAIDTAARIEADIEARTVRVISHAYPFVLLRSLRNAGFSAEPVLQPLG